MLFIQCAHTQESHMHRHRQWAAALAVFRFRLTTFALVSFAVRSPKYPRGSGTISNTMHKWSLIYTRTPSTQSISASISATCASLRSAVTAIARSFVFAYAFDINWPCLLQSACALCSHIFIVFVQCIEPWQNILIRMKNKGNVCKQYNNFMYPEGLRLQFAGCM